MKYFLLFIFMASSVGADGIDRNNRYRVPTSSPSGYIFWPEDYAQWVVVRGTEAFTLDEFIQSERFCKERGKHQWGSARYPIAIPAVYCPGGCSWEYYKCEICGADRRKVKATKQVEEWEP